MVVVRYYARRVFCSDNSCMRSFLSRFSHPRSKWNRASALIDLTLHSFPFWLFSQLDFFEKCGNLIEPILEMNGDIDNYKCPECGSSLYANTGGIHVRGKDM